MKTNKGIHIIEGYGMSETTGTGTIGRNYHFRVGTVGPAMDGFETVTSLMFV